MAAQRLANERLAPIAFIGAEILILTSALFPAADDPAHYDGFLAHLAEHTAGSYLGHIRATCRCEAAGIDDD